MGHSSVIGIVTIAIATWVASPVVFAQALPDRPLTLEDCVLIALERNPQITSSEQGIIGAQAGLTRARSSYYPQLSLSAVEGLTSRTTGLSTGGGTVGSGGSNTREDLDLTARMTFWQRGRRESVAQSAASLRSTELNHAATEQGLVEQVARDYYGVLATQQLVAVAEEGVASAREHWEQVRARIALGATAQVDIFTAEDDLARAQLDLIDARSSVRTALAGLKNTIAVPLGTSVEVTEAPPPQEWHIPLVQEGVEIALENRPDLLASQAALQGSRYALAQAKIRRGPVIDVTGQYVRGYTDWEARDPSWNVSLGLSWPLFDGYATKADETAASASLEHSRADSQRLINQVALDVENAVVEAERTRERVAATATSVAAAEARLAAAEGKYQQGVGILLEVIDARLSVTSARANQVRARYDYQIAQVGLQRAVGTLWVPEIPERQRQEVPGD